MNRYSFPTIWLIFYFTFIGYLFVSTIFFSFVSQLTSSNVRYGLLLYVLLFLYWVNNLKVTFIFNFRIKNLKVKLILFVLIIVLFVQGFFSAPNNTDSMVYRLPRLVFWSQEQSVFQSEKYTEHDYMPGLADYVLLHFYLLFENDRFLFVSQLLAYITSLVLVLKVRDLIMKKSSERDALLLLAATLPMALLQSNSTQVDLVETAFFLYTVYFSLKFFREQSMFWFLLMSISWSFAFLIKSTFVFWGIVPIGIVSLAFYQSKINLLKVGLLVILGSNTFIFITVGYFVQNIHLYGSILGFHSLGTEHLSFFNESWKLGDLLSVLVKNLFSHIPVPLFGKQLYFFLSRVHNFFGLDIQNPRNSWLNEKFVINPMVYPHEDLAGNTIVLILFLFSIYIFFKNLRKFDRLVKTLVIMSICSFVLFSFVIKWQPWHSRLELPLFYMLAILVSILLINYKRLLLVATMLSILLTFPIIALNFSRPLINYKISIGETEYGGESIFIANRNMQYFRSRRYWYEPYENISKLINSDTKSLKLLFMDQYEYPFMVMNLHKELIFIKNGNAGTFVYTAKYPNNVSDHCLKTDINYGYICIRNKYD